MFAGGAQTSLFKTFGPFSGSVFVSCGGVQLLQPLVLGHLATFSAKGSAKMLPSGAHLPLLKTFRSFSGWVFVSNGGVQVLHAFVLMRFATF